MKDYNANPIVIDYGTDYYQYKEQYVVTHRGEILPSIAGIMFFSLVIAYLSFVGKMEAFYLLLLTVGILLSVYKLLEAKGLFFTEKRFKKHYPEKITVKYTNDALIYMDSLGNQRAIPYKKVRIQIDSNEYLYVSTDYFSVYHAIQSMSEDLYSELTGLICSRVKKVRYTVSKKKP